MKINKLIAACAIFATIISSAPFASAVPAPKQPITVTQADGSTITILIHGDEWAHYTTSLDNHLLLDVNGVYQYGMIDSAGKVIASGVKATNNPSAIEKSFLSSIDADKIIQTRYKEIFDATATKRATYAQRFSASTLIPDKKRVAPTLSGMLTTTFPSTGKQKSIVILVEYKDVKFNTTNPYDYFNRMLNEKDFSDFGSIGSAHDYFIDSSNGQFDCDFDLYGPVTLPENRSYYGGNDRYGDDLAPEQMAVHACQALDDTVDFSQYDRDNDGVIDNIFIFYAGAGEATGGGANTVWPHSWDVRYTGKTYKFDGKILGNYACSNEWQTLYRPNRADGIGTFVHEFSHVMGLPDLYETTYSTGAFTPGEWSVLDEGPYNYNGLIPPAYGAFERISLGWLAPGILSGPANLTINEIANNEAFVIPTEKSNEFFILENRQQNNFDKYLPYHGMLVWHIDYNRSDWTYNSVNNTKDHQRVDLIEANNQKSYSDAARRGNPFPGTSNVTSFTSETTPALKSWAGRAIDLPLTDITEKNGVIMLKVAGGINDLAPVSFLPATNLTPYSFTLNWNPVQGAGYYTVSISANGETLSQYNMLNVGNVTSFNVTGLEPLTLYTASVTAFDPTGATSSTSETSLNVSTTEITFEYIIPTAYTSNRTDTEANLLWEPVDGAAFYLVDIFSNIPGEAKQDILDFNDGYAYLPQGWTTDCNENYESSIFSNTPPSLCMKPGNFIQSPEYKNGITAISFWCRTSSLGTKNLIRIEFLVDGAWTTFTSMAAPSSKTTVNINSGIPEGATALRLTYTGDADEKMGLDDIKISYISESLRIPLGNYTNYSVPNSTSLRATGLDPATEYFFTVRGHNGNVSTLPSAETPIVKGAAVSTIISDDENTPARYFNLQGLEINPENGLNPGIYIIRRGASTSKILIH